MSETGSVSASAPPESDSNRPQLYKLIFEQNLDEVHLLIDFVSGRAGCSLTTLTIPGLHQSSGAMTAREIIQAVADMRFPPKGPEAANEENASLLLLAKDGLSALAAPATGLTIAYTAMYIDAEVKTWPRRILDWVINAYLRWVGERNNRNQQARRDAPDQRVD